MEKTVNMTVNARKLSSRLAGLWTIRDVAKAFGKTPMTINTWRREKEFPSVDVPGDKRPAVRFIPADVIAWAKLNNIPVNPPIKRYR